MLLTFSYEGFLSHGGTPQFYQPSILGYLHLWNPPFVYDEPGAASASGIVDTTALRSSALPGDANHRIYDGGIPISGNLDIYIYIQEYIYIIITTNL